MIPKDIVLKVKVKGYTLHITDIDIAGADRSVGIMSEYLEGYTILGITKNSKAPKNYPALYDKFYDDPKYQEPLEKAIFNGLYKLQEIKNKESWRKAKKRGYKGTYSEFASEYT